MTILTIEERIAVSICWLSRQVALAPGVKPSPIPGKIGLPASPALRMAIEERHETTCGWCDYPLEELIRLVGTVDPTDPDVRSFVRLPVRQQRERVEHSQAKEGVA